jgi:hypothetical protein
MRNAKNLFILSALTLIFALGACQNQASENTADVEGTEKKECCKSKEECDQKKAAGECTDEDCEKPCCAEGAEKTAAKECSDEACDKEGCAEHASADKHECGDDCKENCDHHASADACPDDCEKPCCKEA